MPRTKYKMRFGDLTESICKWKECNNFTKMGYKNIPRDFCGTSCAGKHRMSIPRVRDSIKKTNMERYGSENPFGSKKIQNKIRQTNLERYGVDNPSKSAEIQDKIRNAYFSKTEDEILEIVKKCSTTNLNVYGHANPFGSKKIQDKIKQTNLERHGAPHVMKLKEFVNKTQETNLLRYGKKCTTQPSVLPPSVELKLSDYKWLHGQLLNKSAATLAEQLGISNSKIFRVMKFHSLRSLSRVSKFQDDIRTLVSSYVSSKIRNNDRSCIYPHELDIYLPDLNMAIECNGDYYHSERDKGNASGRGKEYHLSKTKLCEEKGIQLIHIWEHDWIKNPELIKRRLLSKLGKTEKVYARKTQLTKLTTNTARNFLNQHHLQGTCPASVKYGLYEGEELVAVMSLGKSRFSKNYEWELLRYCSTKQVIGGASKLFKHFQREYQPNSVVSYSDKMWNTGNLYKKLGFVHSHASKPSYYYTKNYLDFENRVAYQKHKLHEKLENFDPNKTEWENMQANGFDRIWDCGSDVWAWSVSNSRNSSKY